MAEEAVQDAFVKLLKKPPQDENVRAWLYRVATNAARDGADRQRRLRLTLRRAWKRAEPNPTAPAADEGVERGERAAWVRAALAQLSGRERTVLLMREEGFSHQEIAKTVGTTVKSVGSMVARALNKLEAKLKEARHQVE